VSSAFSEGCDLGSLANAAAPSYSDRHVTGSLRGSQGLLARPLSSSTVVLMVDNSAVIRSPWSFPCHERVIRESPRVHVGRSRHWHKSVTTDHLKCVLARTLLREDVVLDAQLARPRVIADHDSPGPPASSKTVRALGRAEVISITVPVVVEDASDRVWPHERKDVMQC
jgi:hypothetical protein